MLAGGPFRELNTLISAAMADDNPEYSGADIKILDAVMDVIGIHGDQGLTIDLVAKHARVSRMTVFRRFGTKDSLIDEAHRREIRSVLHEVGRQADNAHTVAACLEAIVMTMVDSAAKSPAVQWMLRADTSTAVYLWRDRNPSGQQLGRFFVSQMLQQSRFDDPLPADRADFVADVALRLMMSLVLVPDPAFRKADHVQTRIYIHDVVTRLLTADWQ